MLASSKTSLRATTDRRVAGRPVTAVVGLQFGDEGKGQVTDALAADHDLVVRVNGGANAGHSIHVDGERFAVHLVPSGILQPACTNVLTNGVALDPDVLLREIDALRARGVAVTSNLVVSHRAHVVLPWHRVEDGLRNRISGLDTTGRGIGPAYADKMHRHTAVRVGDLLDAATIGPRIAEIARLKDAVLGALSTLVGVSYESIDVAGLTDRAHAWAERMRPFVADTSELLLDALASGRRVLVEGAHAALLDVEQGTYPFVTSSVCLPNGIAAQAGIPDGCLGRVIGVMKAYTSRVGAGPFATEIHGDDAERLRTRGNEYGTTTGRPRRVGGLDLPAVARVARIGGITELAVTGLGVLYADPIVESVDLIATIEREVAPVSYVAVGPARDQLRRR